MLRRDDDLEFFVRVSYCSMHTKFKQGGTRIHMQYHPETNDKCSRSTLEDHAGTTKRSGS